MVDAVMDDDGAGETCDEVAYAVQEQEEFATPSGAAVTVPDLRAAVTMTKNGVLRWEATGSSTAFYLTLDALPEEEITAYTCGDKLDGFSVPAHLTLDSEDGLLSAGFTGAVALTGELLFSESYYRIGLPLDFDEEREASILPESLACPAPRAYRLDLYGNGAAEEVELFEQGIVVASSVSGDTGTELTCGTIGRLTLSD